MIRFGWREGCARARKTAFNQTNNSNIHKKREIDDAQSTK